MIQKEPPPAAIVIIHGVGAPPPGENLAAVARSLQAIEKNDGGPQPRLVATSVSSGPYRYLQTALPSGQILYEINWRDVERAPTGTAGLLRYLVSLFYGSLDLVDVLAENSNARARLATPLVTLSRFVRGSYRWVLEAVNVATLVAVMIIASLLAFQDPTRTVLGCALGSTLAVVSWQILRSAGRRGFQRTAKALCLTGLTITLGVPLAAVTRSFDILAECPARTNACLEKACCGLGSTIQVATTRANAGAAVYWPTAYKRTTNQGRPCNEPAQPGGHTNYWTDRAAVDLLRRIARSPSLAQC